MDKKKQEEIRQEENIEVKNDEAKETEEESGKLDELEKKLED